MPIIHPTPRNGATREFEAPAGLSLMEALRDTAGLDIAAICGGTCSCATCHIYVPRDWWAKLPKQAPDEVELIEFLPGFRDTSRLACQIPVSDALDGMPVELAPEA